ncbi:MAG TPA: SGNH/GDSL hydrolase family protein [Solirubrobacteraceae bacterium]
MRTHIFRGVGRRRGGLIAALVTALVVLAGAGPASAAKLYLALGDSVGAGFGASPGHSYFDLYCSYLESAAGSAAVDQCVNESQSGTTTQSALDGGMVDQAVSDIQSSTDAPVVTIILGGNDLLGSPGCQPITGPDCPFMANAATILDRLESALATHPGPHVIKWLEYYNANHDNPFGDSPEDASTAGLLLGSDLAIGDCAGTPDQIGLNDAINCISIEKGAVPVDAYDPFQSSCAPPVVCFHDGLHPNDTGYGLIFNAFRDASASPVAPIPPPASAPPPPAAGTPPPPPATLATISALSVSNKAFVPSHRHFKGGTVFSLRLDQPAKITVFIARLAAGRRIHHRCRPNHPHLAGRPRCTRAIPIVELRKQGHSGLNRVRFDGRVHGRGLRPGRYLATVSATDSAGVSPARELRFTISRPHAR